MNRNKPSLALTAAAAASLLLGACATSLTGRSQLALISTDEANKMGAQAYQEMMNAPDVRGRIVTSGAAWSQVDRIARRIVAPASKDEPGFQWEWRLIDDPGTVNAFCLPGGKIAVYTGIMRVAQSDDELAAVVGHEVAHATLHHGRKRVSQAILMGLAGDTVGDFAGLDSSSQEVLLGAMGAVANSFDAYSRDDETEADIIGLKYLIEAGYDPEAAVRFWQRMTELGGSSTPEFLSTHPSHATRIDNLRKAIELHRTIGDDAWRFDHYTYAGPSHTQLLAHAKR